MGQPFSFRSGDRFTEQIAPGVFRLRVLFVNLFYVGTPEAWVLVDAGLYGSANRILKGAEACFGRGARPKAVILTHGHFDHVGAIEVADYWDVPIYAHRLEAPYLTGRSSYPPPDPTVGGGGMALMSWAYPKGPIDVSHRLRPLPGDGTVPHVDGWTWVHTPGHTPGHVSFFREDDRVLIAGDAFVTTKQESMAAAFTQATRVRRPPAYFTPDWENAYRSVARLLDLTPNLVATGHGKPMGGPRMLHELGILVEHFDELAVPKHGRYVHSPAVADERGVVSLPPPVMGNTAIMVGLGLAAAAAVAAGVLTNQREEARYRHLPSGRF